MAHEGLGRLIQAAEWREIRGNEKEGPICFRRQMGMKMVDSGTGVGGNCIHCIRWLGTHEIKWTGFYNTGAIKEEKGVQSEGLEIHMSGDPI